MDFQFFSGHPCIIGRDNLFRVLVIIIDEENSILVVRNGVKCKVQYLSI